MTETLGFIGLGNMGLPMAKSLVRAGYRVRGYDLSPDAIAALRDVGGEGAASVADAVRDAAILVTMLPAGRQVRDVVTEAIEYVQPGALVIDSSTIDVATARALADLAAGRGMAMLDAPVSGGSGGATAATLTFMVGGTAEDFARAQPVLTAMGRTIVHAGGSGAGQAAKLCNNLLLAITMVGVGEAFALAEKLGLSAQSLFDISSTSSGQCWALTTNCPVPGPVPSSPANRDYQAGFATDLMLKDVTLATEAAAASGAASVLGPAARDAFAALSAQGLGARDFSIVAQALLQGQIGR